MCRYRYKGTNVDIDTTDLRTLHSGSEDSRNHGLCRILMSTWSFGLYLGALLGAGGAGLSAR